ncbi:MAG: Gfo/Idh/MocA family oxidoreductase [Saprospiraceae bacterium]|nr:Gfo/Idh/MocA family oxidoreductase [Saprospiraceae bacterium]
MNKKIGVCIVGLGRAGRFHLKSIKNLDIFHLKYVVDTQLSEDDEVVQQHDFKLLKTIDEALNDDTLNAVVVSSPTQFHFDYITRSLDAGKHVFTEKPLGKTLAEIQSCFDLAAKKGLALYLGFQRRYDYNFKTLKSTIDQIQPIKIIKTSSRDNPKPSLEYLKISGNIFHDMLIHDFDMLIFLLGTRVPKSVFAFGHAYDENISTIPDFDTALVTIKYDKGLICSIDTSRTAIYGYDQRLELFGEHGMAIAENERNHSVQLHTAEGMYIAPINHSFPQRYKAAYATEMADFGNGILNQQLNNVTKKECVLGHLLANAAHQSAISGQAIDFENYMASQAVSF